MNYEILRDEHLYQREKIDFENLLGHPVQAIEPIGGGKNSKVFKLEDNENRLYAGKAYFVSSNDNRDRLKAESDSFSFLRANGFENVPKVIALDDKKKIAIYQFIKGEKISESVRDADIDDICDFLEFLFKLKNGRDVEQIQKASEANFSLRGIFINLDQRLDRILQVLNSNEDEFVVLTRFIEKEFIPFQKELYEWIFLRRKKLAVPFDDEIPFEMKTLSPSDLGFHNIILDEKGTLNFIDFEYFGWDDPTKTISDFLLHPAMNLSQHHKDLFCKKTLSFFGEKVRERFELAYYLYGLKWCMIILNEFLPKELDRRKFADSNFLSDLKQKRLLQLEKAKAMLENITTDWTKNKI